jgi:hypothetical protein
MVSKIAITDSIHGDVADRYDKSFGETPNVRFNPSLICSGVMFSGVVGFTNRPDVLQMTYGAPSWVSNIRVAPAKEGNDDDEHPSLLQSPPPPPMQLLPLLFEQLLPVLVKNDNCFSLGAIFLFLASGT